MLSRHAGVNTYSRPHRQQKVRFGSMPRRNLPDQTTLQRHASQDGRPCGRTRIR
jgi:hypothetical protein